LYISHGIDLWGQERLKEKTTSLSQEGEMWWENTMPYKLRLSGESLKRQGRNTSGPSLGKWLFRPYGFKREAGSKK
jgi:hypothetical protein